MQPTLTSFKVPLHGVEAGPAWTKVARTPVIACPPFWKHYDLLPLEDTEEGGCSSSSKAKHKQVEESPPYVGQKRSLIEETAQDESPLLGNKKRKTSHTHDVGIQFPGTGATIEHELAIPPELQKRTDVQSGRKLDHGGLIRKVSAEEENETLRPVRKKQKSSHNVEETSSATDSTTETNTEPTDPASDCDMSVDEDFRFAENRLTLLSIQEYRHS